MKIVAGLILMCLFLTSCKGEKDDNTVSFEDLKQIRPEKEYDTDSVKKQETVQVDPNFALAGIVDSLVGNGSWQIWDTLLYPMRFGPEHTYTWIYTAPSDSVAVFELCFKDSLKTLNAFYNWLDCFDQKGTSVTIGTPYRNRGRSAVILVSNNCLFFWESKRGIKPEVLINALEKDPEEQNWNYVVNLPKGGTAQWSQVIKGKIEKLKKYESS